MYLKCYSIEKTGKHRDVNYYDFSNVPYLEINEENFINFFCFFENGQSEYCIKYVNVFPFCF